LPKGRWWITNPSPCSTLTKGGEPLAVELRRGCGFRKVGGLYLIGTGLSVACDRLPHELRTCPICGAGVKVTRGIQWIKGKEFFGGNCPNIKKSPKSPCHEFFCPICHSDALPGKQALMWVGEKHYTPESFIAEANQMTVSKRIATVPNDLILGVTLVLLAHPLAVRGFDKETGKHGKPGIFYAFTPKRVEKIITNQATAEEIEKLKKRGITPVVVPHDDPDHNPQAKKKTVGAPLFEESKSQTRMDISQKEV